MYGCGAGGDEEPGRLDVGAAGRAPGCGAGGSEFEVVVAGPDMGVVRVGGGSAVCGVMAEGLEGIGAMGSFLWIGIGGIVAVVPVGRYA